MTQPIHPKMNNENEFGTEAGRRRYRPPNKPEDAAINKVYRDHGASEPADTTNKSEETTSIKHKPTYTGFRPKLLENRATALEVMKSAILDAVFSYSTVENICLGTGLTSDASGQCVDSEECSKVGFRRVGPA